MPSFADPFSGNVDRKMTNQELAQAIRLDIASELEAIYLYDSHAAATTDPLAKKVLLDIRDEEVAHMGELLTLIRHLDPTIATLMQEGEDEVKEMMQELGITGSANNEGSSTPSTFTATPAVSVGSLIGK